MASEGVSDESTMYILMRLLGGAKKRKKKTYTKPKKQKHKHKKIKLAVLKFYKVITGSQSSSPQALHAGSFVSGNGILVYVCQIAVFSA